MLLAFLSIFVLRRTSLAHVTPYVDPGLVFLVVMISLAVPVRTAKDALMELLNRAPSESVVVESEQALAKAVESLPVEELFVRVIQPGRTRLVAAHVILSRSYEVRGLESFDALRDGALEALCAIHPATSLDLMFSADRKWGAPTGETTAATGHP